MQDRSIGTFCAILFTVRKRFRQNINNMFQMVIGTAKYRAALINKKWKKDLPAYIRGVFQQNDHKMVQINSMSDHVQLFFSYATTSINFCFGSKCKNIK